MILSPTAIGTLSMKERAMRWTLVGLVSLCALLVLVFQGTAFKQNPNESEYVAGAPSWTSEMVAWALLGLGWALVAALVALNYTFSVVVWLFGIFAALFALILVQQSWRTKEDKQEDTVQTLVWCVMLAGFALPALMSGDTIAGCDRGFVNTATATVFMPMFLYLLFLLMTQLIDANITEVDTD